MVRHNMSIPPACSLSVLMMSSNADSSRILDFLPESDRIRVRDECWRILTETGRWCGELALRNFKTGAVIPVLVDWFRIDDRRTGNQR